MSKRRNFTAGGKVSVLREHFLDKAPISDVCERHGIQPAQFYQWQKIFFENGESAFERKSPKKDRREADRIEALEAKVRKKDEVLGELMEEHIALKKSLGEL